ncbi:hypothetical protein [Paenibacillus terrae]|uniref:hypothetical protein n=1 Tax=Paenibacillus TaxID=44249 RepID=UPI0016568D03|nr:hypothetical protein [Paenibacillus terrae]
MDRRGAFFLGQIGAGEQAVWVVSQSFLTYNHQVKERLDQHYIKYPADEVGAAG